MTNKGRKMLFLPLFSIKNVNKKNPPFMITRDIHTGEIMNNVH